MAEHANKGFTNLHKWLLSITIASLSVFLLYNSESMEITMFWFLTFFGISLFAFEPIPNTISALLLSFAYIVFKVASPQVVFSGWTGFIPWVIFAGICIGELVEKTGFARRLSLIILNKIAKTPLLLFLAFLVAGYVMNFFIAEIVTNIIVLGTFGLSICKALNLNPGSKASTSIMLACYVAGSSVGVNFYPNNLGLIAFEMLREQGISVTWIEFFVDNFSLAFVSSLVSFLILYFYSRKEISEKIQETREYFESECGKLGKISAEETRTFILLLLAIFSLILEPYHGISGLFLMAFVILLAFCPPFSLLDKNDFSKMNFGILIFIVGCMSIGLVAASLGIPSWLSHKLIPVLSEIDSVAGISVFSYAIGILVNFILTPVAAAVSLTSPIADIAMSMDFTAKPVVYSFLLGLDQWLLPYEVAPVLFLYATGYMRLKHIFIVMTIRMVALAIVVWLNANTVWTWMGF